MNATDPQLSTPAAELLEFAAAWPGLSPEIQAAVLTLVRVASARCFSEDIRLTLPNPTF